MKEEKKKSDKFVNNNREEGQTKYNGQYNSKKNTCWEILFVWNTSIIRFVVTIGFCSHTFFFFFFFEWKITRNYTHLI